MFLNQNNHVQFTLKLAKKAVRKINELDINCLRCFSCFILPVLFVGIFLLFYVVKDARACD
ncbi:hypothetical protein C9J47_24930 [Photobacterium indicum]|uniref:Uncharacterized protein n=1 Tax=Photobacterium indicum TaxID=81447 RepID=A0A2T3L1S5_9GAMM|nr:hypothetical protein C9J47_24930 [Photobacterium indicum]